MDGPRWYKYSETTRWCMSLKRLGQLAAIVRALKFANEVGVNEIMINTSTHYLLHTNKLFFFWEKAQTHTFSAIAM